MSTAATTTIEEAVERGLQIRAHMAELKAELAEIETLLKNTGFEEDQVSLEEEEREGRQWIAPGDTHVVPVVYTADYIQSSFAENSRMHLRAQSVAEHLFDQFYVPKIKYEMTSKSGFAFRREARALLGVSAPDFIAAVTARDKWGVPRTAVKVEWDRAREKGAGA